MSAETQITRDGPRVVVVGTETMVLLLSGRTVFTGDVALVPTAGLPALRDVSAVMRQRGRSWHRRGNGGGTKPRTQRRHHDGTYLRGS